MINHRVCAQLLAHCVSALECVALQRYCQDLHVVSTDSPLLHTFTVQKEVLDTYHLTQNL